MLGIAEAPLAPGDDEMIVAVELELPADVLDAIIDLTPEMRQVAVKVGLGRPSLSTARNQSARRPLNVLQTAISGRRADSYCTKRRARGFCWRRASADSWFDRCSSAILPMDRKGVWPCRQSSDQWSSCARLCLRA